MSYNQSSKKYLRKFGIFEVTIEDVKNDSFKGNEFAVVVMKSKDDSYIDWKFKKPLTEISKNQIRSLIKNAGGNEGNLGSVKGKNILILVAPNEFGARVFWNPVKVWASSFSKYLTTGEDTFGIGEPMPNDIGNEDDFGL